MVLLIHAQPTPAYDVFDDCAASRRPYSEGFSEHMHVAAGGGLGNGLCVGPAAAPDAQRAMYLRSSYAESELVKSTFDLAKLLPSAPQ
ncbi:hypothetical protein LPJ61_001778 [Coemansia biformis]|uniref:Uncharacterized protein n=1 Tax=Coemansia biformis TaxID=1286918 RepID=A0A9W7YFR7_9FUNG|nr:hypothetical protein LPJ61_001778 [Coemansia biformis]